MKIDVETMVTLPRSLICSCIYRRIYSFAHLARVIVTVGTGVAINTINS